jgi:Tfp pilus assembly protein PilN
MSLLNLPSSIRMNLSLDNIGFIKGKRVAGVHLTILQDDSWSLNLVLIEKKGNKLKNSVEAKGITTIPEFRKFVPVGCPISLSLDGKGLIHRVIKEQNGISAILQVLPNANPAEFIEQSQKIEDSDTYFSLIRRDTLAKITDEFVEAGYYLFHINFGPFSLNTIWSILENKQSGYSIGSYVIRQKNGIIYDMQLNPSTTIFQSDYSIGNDSIPGEFLIPYANGISFFIDSPTRILSPDFHHPNGRNDFLFKRLFHVAGLTVLLSLFTVLLVNFLIFDYYRQLYNESSLQYKSGLELISKLDRLKQEIESKGMIVKENDFLNRTNYAFYADQLAACLPEQIKLTRMELDPLLSKPKREKELEIQHNYIRITGNCKNSITLDNWLETLKKHRWIREVEILQYKQEGKDSMAEFTIQIMTE